MCEKNNKLILLIHLKVRHINFDETDFFLFIFFALNR